MNWSSHSWWTSKFVKRPPSPPHIHSFALIQLQNNGGLLTDKIPHKGYIISEPETADGQRLLANWRKDDKPERYFVPCAFISSCIRANKVHRMIFIDENDGLPIKFHIHASISAKIQRQKCKERILVGVLILRPTLVWLTSSVLVVILSRTKKMHAS